MEDVCKSKHKLAVAVVIKNTAVLGK